MTQVSPGLQQLDVVSEGVRRIYLIYVPKTYYPGVPMPTIVVLHGGGGSATFAVRVHGWRALSERQNCLVVFPEALPGDPTQPAGIRENPRIWNDGSRRNEVRRPKVNDIGYLSNVLDDVCANLAVDANRIFVTGFSNGASMAFRVGVELSNRVAAIAPVSGHLCIKDPNPDRAVSMLYVIGDADPINPVAGGSAITPWGTKRQRPPVMDSIRTWIRLVGASEEPVDERCENGVSFARYGPGESGCEVRYYTIEGQGHEWPGAERTLPRSFSGAQTKKMNATKVIWDFFEGIGKVGSR